MEELRFFILQYNDKFTRYLQDLSPSTRELIRKNKDLDKLFDLILDYTIDSSQKLDYMEKNWKDKETPLQ